MAVSKQRREELVREYGRGEKDTGSAEVLAALYTERIKGLTEHFRANKKDHHSRQGLLRMVARRRRALDYLRSRSPERYERVLASLGLRR